MKLQIPKTTAIVVLLLGAVVGGYFLLRGGYQAPAPSPAVLQETPEEAVPEEETLSPTSPVKEFAVSGTEYRFSPSSITVSAGEKVKITFRNDGRIGHNFVVRDLGISTRTIGGGEIETIELTAPAAGTYTFICSVPGHAQAGMVGDLVVE